MCARDRLHVGARVWVLAGACMGLRMCLYACARGRRLAYVRVSAYICMYDNYIILAGYPLREITSVCDLYEIYRRIFLLVWPTSWTLALGSLIVCE